MLLSEKFTRRKENIEALTGVPTKVSKECHVPQFKYPFNSNTHKPNHSKKSQGQRLIITYIRIEILVRGCRGKGGTKPNEATNRKSADQMEDAGETSAAIVAEEQPRTPNQGQGT